MSGRRQVSSGHLLFTRLYVSAKYSNAKAANLFICVQRRCLFSFTSPLCLSIVVVL